MERKTEMIPVRYGTGYEMIFCIDSSPLVCTTGIGNMHAWSYRFRWNCEQTANGWM